MPASACGARRAADMLLFVKNLVFTIVVPGTVAGYLPYRIASRRGGWPDVTWGPLQGAAVMAWLAGGVIYLWCVRDFAVVGRGTPAPIDAPRTLVVTGLYRWVRNPMYLAVLLVLSGWAAFFESRDLLIYAAAIWILFALVVLIVEEPLLRRKFGASYAAYCRQVGRWVPRRPRGA